VLTIINSLLSGYGAAFAAPPLRDEFVGNLKEFS